MKKLLSIFTALCFVLSPVSYAEISVITEHKGLQRLEEDKIESGAHARFSNVYVTDDSNIRIVKGRDKLNSTANADTNINGLWYYESNAPITGGDVSGAVLMLHLNGTDGSTTFTDSGGTGHGVGAVGDAQIDTSFFKFGGSSAIFDSSGDYLLIGDSSDWEFGTSDLTIDFWFRMDSVTTRRPFEIGDSSSDGIAAIVATSGNFRVVINGTSYNFAHTPIANTWYHAAIIRNGSNLKVFINGSQIGTTQTNSSNITSGTNGVRIGAWITDPGELWDGHLDEFRILNGTAAWTSNFTVPDAEYSDGSSQTNIKKYVVAFSDNISTYDTDWTNKTQIVSGLVDEEWDAVQINNDMYFNSSSNGLYKWAGSGSATAVGSVSAPSSVDFSASSTAGGKTSGLDAIVVHEITSGGSEYRSSGGVCIERPAYVADFQEDNTACTSLNTNFTKTCATDSTYKFKVTSYNKEWGIESEPSSADTALLSGADTVSVAGRSCWPRYSDTSCTTYNSDQCDDTVIVVTGEETSASGTLASAPSNPFNQYCIYSTVSDGEEYFLEGCTDNFGGTFLAGKPDVALTRPLDTTIDTIAPPSFRYIEQYKGTIFTAEDNEIRFTRLPVNIDSLNNEETYWLETDLLNTSVATEITGMHNITNNLLIFTQDTVLSLSGFGVGSFRLSNLLTGIGAISDEAIETDNNGDVIFFAGVRGVYKLRVGQQRTDDLTGAVINQPDTNVVRISSPFLDDVFNGTDSEIVLDPADYASSHAYYDRDNDLYWLFIDDQAFLFNNKSGQWSYIPATKAIASVYRASPNAVGQGLIIDDLGFAYDNWKGYENGVESGTVTGNPTGSTSTTLTDSGASYSVTGDGLAGAWVFVDNENGEYRQIQSNTATALTVSPAWTTNPTTADDYYIGYIVVDFKTKQYNFVQPPQTNKIDMIYVIHSKAESTQELELISYEEKSTTPNNLKPIDLSLRYVDKRMIPMGRAKFWFQWQGRSFVYNTSNTITPPVEIQSYAIDWTEMEEY